MRKKLWLKLILSRSENYESALAKPNVVFFEDERVDNWIVFVTGCQSSLRRPSKVIAIFMVHKHWRLGADLTIDRKVEILTPTISFDKNLATLTNHLHLYFHNFSPGLHRLSNQK